MRLCLLQVLASSSSRCLAVSVHQTPFFSRSHLCGTLLACNNVRHLVLGNRITCSYCQSVFSFTPSRLFSEDSLRIPFLDLINVEGQEDFVTMDFMLHNSLFDELE